MTHDSHPVENQVEKFRSLVAEGLGLHFDESKTGFLKEVLLKRLEDGGFASPKLYFQALQSNLPEEIDRLAKALTVTETFFLRNKNHLRALVETVLPERMRLREQAGERKLRLLSAGCASGEEPYSLAITLKEHFPALSSWDVTLHAVDINPAMLEQAAAGVYSPWSLRDTPPRTSEKFFRVEGRNFRIADEIRSMVTFEKRNLSEANPDLCNAHSDFDVVFCCNMLMYFVPETAARVVDCLKTALTPGGYLFLGSAETLRGLSQDFHLCHTEDTFYYQRMKHGETPRPFHHWHAVTHLPDPVTHHLMPVDDSVDWVEAIQKASNNIHRLHAKVSSQTRTLQQAGSDVLQVEAGESEETGEDFPPSDMAEVLSLVKEERFPEALVALDRLPPEWAGEPHILLVRAVLQCNTGDREGGKALCQRLLEEDELNVGAHYLMALCLANAGDQATAEEHDRLAIYLDPTFAMPFLHLGLLAKRTGRPDEGRRYLEQCLTTLAKGEHESRIMLFGGGFGRESLAQICRSELGTLRGS